MPPFPPMRYVDVFPVDHEGERYVCLSDPQGYVEEQLMLSGPAFFVAACLDGAHDAAMIQRAFEAQFPGARVPEAQIHEVVNYLDESGFLLNGRFAQMRDALEQTFRQSAIRPAYFAGKGYPAAPEELRAFLEDLMGECFAPAPAAEAAPLKCLIVPHIDYLRGAEAYAAGYRRLFGAGKPDTVFIFGVAHAGATAPFVLTRKAFDTPFGALRVDEDVLHRLEAVCDWDPYAEELVHRTEHSIEFQAVMLGAYYGTNVKIVPILCAAFSDDPAMRSPGTLPQVARFLEVCREIAQDPERRVSVIAGADLAHVGKRFGDDFEISEPILQDVEARDTEDLAHAHACAPEAFYGSVMQDENARRVCGLGCIYAALKCVEGQALQSELLHYGHAPDPAGGIVSFASLQLS